MFNLSNNIFFWIRSRWASVFHFEPIWRNMLKKINKLQTFRRNKKQWTKHWQRLLSEMNKNLRSSRKWICLYAKWSHHAQVKCVLVLATNLFVYKHRFTILGIKEGKKVRFPMKSYFQLTKPFSTMSTNNWPKYVNNANTIESLH